MRKRFALLKYVILYLFLIMIVILLSACKSASDDFKNDQNGQIANSFFPVVENLQPDIQTTFEYKKTLLYEGYFLKLTFSSSDEYQLYLDNTECHYSDMTELQRQKSHFIIERVRFSVGNYNFRAIDLTDYGYTDEPFVGVIAHCDSSKTIVFMYFQHQLSGIETIEEGLGKHGYMEYYTELWWETQ